MKPDKIMHLSISYALTLTLALFGWVVAQRAGALCGIALVVILCIGKEIYDWTDYGKAMGWRAFRPLTLVDLAADAAGLASAVVLADLLIRLLGA